MTRKVRSAITLAVMLVVVVLGGTWAWAALTNPFPEGGLFGGSTPETQEEVCTPRELSPGDELTPGEVTVSVLNAGSESGAAAATLDDFVERGFAEGVQGNAPDDADVDFVQVWAEDPSSPAVRLVVSWLGENTLVVERELDTPGVHVVVGDQFGDLIDGRSQVQVRRDVEVCGPANAG